VGIALLRISLFIVLPIAGIFAFALAMKDRL
jgi:hypothetical protein